MLKVAQIILELFDRIEELKQENEKLKIQNQMYIECLKEFINIESEE